MYDKDSGKFTFIRNKEMYADYIEQIFNHLIEKNLWSITRVMADQPKNTTDVCECEDLLREIREDVKIKYAIMDLSLIHI